MIVSSDGFLFRASAGAMARIGVAGKATLKAAGTTFDIEPLFTTPRLVASD